MAADEAQPAPRPGGDRGQEAQEDGTSSDGDGGRRDRGDGRGGQGGGEDAVDPRNQLNHLTGSQWLYQTRTVWRTSYPHEYGHDRRRTHGANKPPQLMKRLIELFTQSDDRVLDPFAGVGGTLIGAAISDPPRRAVGIDINPQWRDIYHQVVADHDELPKYPLRTGDCLGEMARMEPGSFHFITMDPPYNIHLEQTMVGEYSEEHTNRRSDYAMYSEQAGDLANLDSYEDYLQAMEAVFARCMKVLEAGCYMTVIVRDAYQDGRYLFTHADLARRAAAQGFLPKGEIIWYQTGARLRPYGYPYAYVPNIVHQHILVFRKPRE